jgi:hypothetical protein
MQGLPILEAAQRYTAERPSPTDWSPLPATHAIRHAMKVGIQALSNHASMALGKPLKWAVAGCSRQMLPTFCVALPHRKRLVHVQLVSKLLARHVHLLVALPRDSHVPAGCGDTPLSESPQQHVTPASGSERLSRDLACNTYVS